MLRPSSCWLDCSTRSFVAGEKRQEKKKYLGSELEVGREVDIRKLK